jgi:hypothetical protein
MSLSDVYRDRYYASGYVYIAGSFSSHLIKIGTTQNIGDYQKRLRSKKYGSVGDWVLLYYIWVDQAGKVEHDARRSLHDHQVLRMYLKDGSWQKGREIVRCSFAAALEALADCEGDRVHSEGWKSRRCEEFDFDP